MDLPGTGMFYISISWASMIQMGRRTGAVAVIDPKTKKVVKRFFRSPSTIVRRRKEWLWGRTVRSC